jgi:hypothetical protein
MNRILEYFINDPLRILYLLGGTGGIWFWFGQWRDRVRVRIKIIDETRYVSDGMQYVPCVTCEIENIGGRPTSMLEVVTLTGYTPKKRYKVYQGKLQESDRKLSPHEPKILHVDFPDDVDYEGLLFRAYKFRLTRGSSKCLCYWSASLKQMNHFYFIYQKTIFRLFNMYNEDQQ